MRISAEILFCKHHMDVLHCHTMHSSAILAIFKPLAAKGHSEMHSWRLDKTKQRASVTKHVLMSIGHGCSRDYPRHQSGSLRYWQIYGIKYQANHKDLYVNICIA